MIVKGAGFNGVANHSIPEAAKHTAAVKGELREKSIEVGGSTAKWLLVGLELLFARTVSSWEELHVE